MFCLGPGRGERRFSGPSRGLVAAAALSLCIAGTVVAAEPTAASAGHGAGGALSIWAVLPFVGLLLAIAVLPLVSRTAHWWEHNRNRLLVALCFAAITLGYYLVASGPAKVLHVLEHAVLDEYVPFIVLLFSLYVISGGLCLNGDLPAHPGTNTIFLALGAAIASLVGTTGASMVLIRPLLQANAERKRVAHTVIFFIFLVSNVGGCLLPIGDPPLFLGYLRGVPFLWTLRLWVEWATMCAILLAVYFVWDLRAYRHEKKRDIARDERIRHPLTLTGSLNLFWLACVVACVAVIRPGDPLPIVGMRAFPFLRELAMLGFVALSLRLTSKQVRRDNKFNYHAILEVASLFIGIFICMQPPIELLQAAGTALQPLLGSPMRLFWATGTLSSFLDNAPTYAVFFETALSMGAANDPHPLALLDGRLMDQQRLAAVSLGAVFMGAMTYIGNGPNFMVKSIAEQSGVRMPSFFGYMLYSAAILLPLFLVVSWIFL